jgi:L-threonylcarbamoyladenylate synthase
VVRVELSREGGSAIGLVAQALRTGGVVVLPTDTLYGLSTRYDRPAGLRRIATLKGRTETTPFLILVATPAQLAALTTAPPPAGVVELVWPGPVTLLLPARRDLHARLRGPGGAVAVRWPGDPLVLDVLARVGVPVISTSVNRHGEPPLADPEAIARAFGRAIDVLADVGPRGARPPSTIVDLLRRPPVITRQGAAQVDVAELDRRLRPPAR